jgi:hypothetical protein
MKHQHRIYTLIVIASNLRNTLRRYELCLELLSIRNVQYEKSYFLDYPEDGGNKLLWNIDVCQSTEHHIADNITLTINIAVKTP